MINLTLFELCIIFDDNKLSVELSLLILLTFKFSLLLIIKLPLETLISLVESNNIVGCYTLSILYVPTSN